MTNEFIKLLTPQNVFLSKKRIGPPEDGGYVMLDYVLENCSALFTYGVGGDSRYEIEFAEIYKKPTYLFDHVLFAPVAGFEEHQKTQQKIMTKYWHERGCTFFSNGLGFGENCHDFYRDYIGTGIGGYVYLKIDIEGGEYDYFIQTDIDNFANSVMAISLEVHWIYDPGLHVKLLEILNKIEKHFILCHLHGNSWGDVWEFEGVKLPGTIELSFVNKKFVDKYVPDEQDYPIEGLDISNRPGTPDFKLDFLKIKI